MLVVAGIFVSYYHCVVSFLGVSMLINVPRCDSILYFSVNNSKKLKSQYIYQKNDLTVLERR